MISTEQYTFLNQERSKFESLINQGYFSNLSPQWVKEFAVLYKELWPNEPLKFSCGSCLRSAMGKAWNKMKEYESLNTE